ncbi:YgjV family protein [Arthrobacter sp. EpRS71]|uniref:CBU_0592 family membrane protein n=1 Tax=Arthrobacter sp. EpRS71 TaxID=1743141 RepID=UPI0018D23A88|nr:YgjV family protein [Arthrobacter sp. EpRS71]
MELLFEIAGWAGAVAMLGGYMAVSMGWLQAGSTFQTVNLFGSCAFIINGTLHGAWPSVVTNVAWFLISAVALLRMRAKLRPAEATAEPQESPSLGPDTAAQVIVAAARPAASCA